MLTKALLYGSGRPAVATALRFASCQRACVVNRRIGWGVCLLGTCLTLQVVRRASLERPSLVWRLQCDTAHMQTQRCKDTLPLWAKAGCVAVSFPGQTCCCVRQALSPLWKWPV